MSACRRWASAACVDDSGCSGRRGGGSGAAHGRQGHGALGGRAIEIRRDFQRAGLDALGVQLFLLAEHAATGQPGHQQGGNKRGSGLRRGGNAMHQGLLSGRADTAVFFEFEDVRMQALGLGGMGR